METLEHHTLVLLIMNTVSSTNLVLSKHLETASPTHHVTNQPHFKGALDYRHYKVKGFSVKQLVPLSCPKLRVTPLQFLLLFQGKSLNHINQLYIWELVTWFI